MRRFQRPLRNAGRVGLAHWAALYGKPPTEKQTAPGKGAVAEQQSEDQDHADVATAPLRPQELESDPAEAKAVVVNLSTTGTLPIEAVDRMFAHNPGWRSA